ncbi:MMPL family transporter [Paenibacillus prosopidis]|uniref:Membrane protein YdfJ n=1 Tax=Paenibacillus prosopidis TaxID=630520 RepID=A0A368VP66_9BACL|nr:MMPL family transporter [Paenibacillus prosopidis]RCW43519.1 membrane protein YdfJ [Paenibacillus prosopidis]
MAKYLYRLGLWSVKNRIKVMLGGLLVVLIAAGMALSIGPAFNEASSIPGLKSQEALELLGKEFPSPQEYGGQIQMVFKAPDQEKLSSELAQQFISNNLKEVAKDKQVKSIANPYENNSLSPDGKIGYATITYNVSADEVSDESKDIVNHVVESMRDAGWKAELTGSGYVPKVTGGSTEGIGIIIAFIILSITFASFLTGILPIVTAIIGLVVGLMSVLLGSNVMDMGSSSLSMAAMLGLAVGIDYALFIVSRYRQELARGYAVNEAAAIANATAGSSVVFAGVTVIIGLAGLAVAQLPFLTGMGIAGAICVLTAVLTAITIMPALLGLLGERVGPKRQNRLFKVFSRKSKSEGNDSLWGRFVTGRPWAIVIVGVVMLSVLAIPFFHINLGMPDDAQKSTEKTERRAYDLLSEGYGEGYHSPLVILATTDGGNESAENLAKVYEWLNTLPNIGTVAPAIPGPSGKVALISVVPSTGAHDIKTKELVQMIRDQAPDIQKQNDVEVLVTGSTAVGIDISQKLNDALPKFAIVIVGLALLLLMVVFRSLLVPIKAVLGFVLSLAATLGFIVYVVQDGHMGNLFGFHAPGPILNFLPIIVVGILFGLAMDYEVFLLSRMREEYKHTGNARRAVLAGIKHSGGVVTAAGLIMVSVFLGFMLSEEAIVKSIGFALAFGILFDTFVVRMMIVPAFMTILGKSAWYLPKWLDRILPNLDIEGESVMEELENKKKAVRPMLRAVADERTTGL